jgi:hypothetical protein
VPYRTPTQKLTGDPGIFGTLGKIFTTVAKVGVGLLPGPIGMAARGAVGLLTPAQQAGRTPAFTPPVVPGGSRPLITFDGGRPGVQTPLGTRGGGPLSGVAPKRRRMDPMNVKALRRATRRLAAFDREKKKVEKQLRLIAPRPTRRSRRDVPPGHGHVR